MKSSKMRESSRNKIEVLEVGRGIAALGVVVFHAAYALPASDNPLLLERIFLAGQTGIYFFFVLSGFVMFWVHEKDFGKKSRAPTYALKRINRIYPIYWVILIPMLLAYWFLPQLGLPQFRETGTIVSAFLLAGDIDPTPLTVAWTLFHEMLFYAFFGLVILSKRIGGAVCIGWMMACAINIWANIDLYVFSPINLLFLFGALAAHLVRNRQIRGKLWLVGGILLYLGTVLLTDAFYMGVPGVIAIGSASTMVIAGSASTEIERGLKIYRPLVILGAISYVLYLAHGPVISVLATLVMTVGLEVNQFAFIFVCIAASIAVSYVIHRLVEKPLLKAGGSAIRRLDENRRANPA